MRKLPLGNNCLLVIDVEHSALGVFGDLVRGFLFTCETSSVLCCLRLPFPFKVVGIASKVFALPNVPPS